MDVPLLMLMISVLTLIPIISCENVELEETKDLRDPRFSIFQIIKFANDPCVGSSRNGTCFTKAECENEGGTESGSCADGFGVCCILILSDGGTTSLNQSYIVQASSTSLGVGSRQYTICPCSSDVCRIRFDFTMFELAAPFTATVGSDDKLAATALAVGDCQIDTFSITGPAAAGSPLICGTNEGQHMIIDTDGSACSTVNIGLGNGAGTTARQWDIMVTQYRCGEEAGGPPGCLQWHMEAAGRFRSFNFPTLARGGDVTATVTHLSNQEYEICIRTPANTNHICYKQCTYSGTEAAIAQHSFGLSVSPNAASKSGVDTSVCISDYIRIVGGTTIANAQAGIGAETNLFCGRYLETGDNLASTTTSVCTSVQPFRVGVHFDGDEYLPQGNSDLTTTEGGPNNGEIEDFPGGIIGFSLCYTTGAAIAAG